MIGSLSVILFFVGYVSALKIHHEPSMYQDGNKWVLNGAGKINTFSQEKSVPVSQYQIQNKYQTAYPLHHHHSSSSDILNSGLINTLPETFHKQSYPVYHDATSTASEHHGHLETPSVDLDQPEHTVYQVNLFFKYILRVIIFQFLFFFIKRI